MERVLCRGSMDDFADPFLGIEHHKDSYIVEAWRSSCKVEVWIVSNTVGARTIVLIRCWVLSTIMIPTPWKCGEVPTLWLYGDGRPPWKQGRLC